MSSSRRGSRSIRHLGQFRGDSQFTTWATRIAVNAALAHARKQPVIAEVVDEPDSHTPDEAVEHAAARQDPRALPRRAAAGQPRGDGAARRARARHRGDRGGLGLSEEAVRVRLHRARAAVAASLVDRIDNVYKFDGARCDRITRHVMAAILLARVLLAGCHHTFP